MQGRKKLKSKAVKRLLITLTPPPPLQDTHTLPNTHTHPPKHTHTPSQTHTLPPKHTHTHTLPNTHTHTLVKWCKDSALQIKCKNAF